MGVISREYENWVFGVCFVLGLGDMGVVKRGKCTFGLGTGGWIRWWI